MSSVSRSSRISAKSQVIIAAQDGQIAAMRAAMIAAGLDPDLILPVPVTNESVTELMEVDVATNPKKRMPSGSPDGKEEESGTDDSYDGAIDGMEEEESSRPDWRMYQLKKSKKSPDKKMTKKAKRLAKAKAGKAEKAAAVKLPDEHSKPQLNAQPQAGVEHSVGNVELYAVSNVKSNVNVNVSTGASPVVINHVNRAANVNQQNADATNGDCATNANTCANASANTNASANASANADSNTNAIANTVGNAVTSALFSDVVAPCTETVINALNKSVPVSSTPIPPVFKTPAPDGPFRDEVVVDVLSIDGVHYAGTITPVEARKMIYESALGLSQDNLASITIGFNRGRIITFKLRQQIDLDDLYPREHFEFESRAGTVMQVIACKIRGVRNPALRSSTRAGSRMPMYAQNVPPPVDDGTRILRIIGCEFRLTESEILAWLSCFGEVINEITEEQFESEGLETDLPPIGNGIYNVKIRLNKDIPNWLPMYGRKICVDYPGIKKQCSNC